MSEREFLEFKFLKLYTFSCYSCILYLYDFTDNHKKDDTLETSTTLNELLERVRTSTNCEAMNKKKSDDDDDRRIKRVDLTNHSCRTHGCYV